MKTGAMLATITILLGLIAGCSKDEERPASQESAPAKAAASAPAGTPRPKAAARSQEESFSRELILQANCRWARTKKCVATPNGIRR